MWKYINRDYNKPQIKATAKRLTGRSSEVTLKNIYSHVIKKVPYVPDPVEYEQLTAPIHIETGAKIGEDCDGQVMYLVALLQAAGVPARIKTIAWRKKLFTHVIAINIFQIRNHPSVCHLTL